MNSKSLKIAKIAGMGFLAYKLLSFRAVKGIVKTALFAKGVSLLKNKIAK